MLSYTKMGIFKSQDMKDQQELKYNKITCIYYLGNDKKRDNWQIFALPFLTLRLQERVRFSTKKKTDSVRTVNPPRTS